MHISFQISVFISFEYILRSGIVGLYGSSIFSHTVFHSGCTNLHSRNNVLGFPFLHILINICYLLFVNFFMITILTGVSWCLIVVLICISLMISDIEHLFMYLLPICMSSLEKCLFRPSAHFLNGLFVFLKLSCMSCLYILDVVWAVYIFWMLTPYQLHLLQIFFPIQ